jgi:protein TonB
LLIALAAVLVSFEWKTYGGTDRIFDDFLYEDIEDEIIPITIQQEKVMPPLPKEPEKVIIVDDDVVVEKEIFVDSEVSEATEITTIDFLPEEIDDDVIHITADLEPTFPGGRGAMYAFLRENIHYPKIAVQEGIQGKVYLSFVIEKDGSITDVKVLRGIIGGRMCDLEAVRVVESMPKWEHGRRNGRPVRFQFNLPVDFRLK